jgi:hypothetical protein
MSDSPTWDLCADDSDSGVRVIKVVTDTHEPLGQQLLADPLSALLRQGVLLGSGKDWKVQLQLVNADIPSGPLPLPDEIPAPAPSDWFWVIRKIIFFILIYDELDLVVVVGYRYGTDRATALGVLERSLAARRSQT